MEKRLNWLQFTWKKGWMAVAIIELIFLTIISLNVNKLSASLLENNGVAGSAILLIIIFLIPLAGLIMTIAYGFIIYWQDYKNRWKEYDKLNISFSSKCK
jgi:hypothetical protein